MPLPGPRQTRTILSDIVLNYASTARAKNESRSSVTTTLLANAAPTPSTLPVATEGWHHSLWKPVLLTSCDVGEKLFTEAMVEAGLEALEHPRQRGTLGNVQLSCRIAG